LQYVIGIVFFGRDFHYKAIQHFRFSCTKAAFVVRNAQNNLGEHKIGKSAPVDMVLQQVQPSSGHTCWGGWWGDAQLSLLSARRRVKMQKQSTIYSLIRPINFLHYLQSAGSTSKQVTVRSKNATHNLASPEHNQTFVIVSVAS